MMQGQQTSMPTDRALALPGLTLRIVWPAVHVAAGAIRELIQRRFTLAVDVLDDQHAMIEAWTEGAGDRGTVFARRPVRCHLGGEATLLHVDAFDDAGEALCRLSISTEGGAEARLVFAQTRLLAEAGFDAGAADPPVLQRNAHPALATA